MKVNKELRTKIQNSHISLVGTICNFLTPPPPPPHNVIILLLAKVGGLGFRG